MTDHTNELRRLAQAALTGPDGVSLNWVKLLQDFQKEASPAAVLDLLDRLEAAEKARDALRAELDALKAWKAEVEAQKPVGYWDPCDDVYFLPGFLLPHSEAKMEPRYARPVPGAKGEEK